MFPVAGVTFGTRADAGSALRRQLRTQYASVEETHQCFFVRSIRTICKRGALWRKKGKSTMTTLLQPDIRRRRLPSGLIILIGLMVLILIGGLIFVAQAPTLTSATTAESLPAGWQRISVEPGLLETTVSATGSVEPVQQADVRFSVDGDGDTIADTARRAGRCGRCIG